MNLILPWPPSALSPNARHPHWSSLAKAKKSYRTACALQARAQGATRLTSTKLLVSLLFVPPGRRPRDLDNCISSMKAGLDGLADVFGVDDSRWQLLAELDRSGTIGGFVRVEVRPCLP